MEANSNTWVPKYVMISIDGGGIRGRTPALILRVIEETIRNDPDLKDHNAQHLYQYVDLMAGTSTGGILSVGISAGVDAKVLEGFYSTTASAQEIFTKNTKCGHWYT